MPITFNPQKALAAANDLAETQEANFRDLLWDRLTDKVQNDEEFRKGLAADPKRAIHHEAERVAKDSGQTVGPAVVEKIADRFQAVYSSIMPGLTLGRVEGLIFETIQDLKHAYKITLRLSQVLFYSGLAMVIAGFFAGLLGDHKLISTLFACGGIGSMLISSLVVSPLDRVQNSAGNLVQLQMAYLSYYKQLYLLGGNNSAISRTDALQYSKVLSDMTVKMMGSVSTYVDRGGNNGHMAVDQDGQVGKKTTDDTL